MLADGLEILLILLGHLLQQLLGLTVLGLIGEKIQRLDTRLLDSQEILQLHQFFG